MDSPSDIELLCRLCLVKDQVNIPIFEEQGDIRQIFLKISSCLPVSVSREDNLPKKICDGCLDKLDLLYDFWNTSVNAEKTLLTWLGQAGVKDADETITAVAQQIAKPETQVKVEDHETNVDGGVVEEFEEEAKDEEEPPPKRARRSAAVKAQMTLTNDSDEDEDDDFDTAEPMTKMEDESEESEGEEKDPSYNDVPGTSADDQPGPSGLGKDGADAPTSSYKCLICTTIFTTKPLLQLHLHSHTEPEHCCSFCTKTFSSLLKLNNHMVKSHGLIYKCNQCPLFFLHEQALQNHVQEVHLKQYNFICTLCDKGFVLQTDFRYHRESTHEPKKPCKICGQLVPSTRDLREHLQKHKGRKTWAICPICKEGVTCLRQHMKQSHSEERRFTCEICGKAFKDNNALRIHLNVHNDVRPHVCEICGKRFLTKQHMVVHLRRHTGETPYKCSSCDRAFATRGQLVSHHRTHSGEKPFGCQFCQRKFKMKKYLKIHVNAAHLTDRI